MLYQTPTFPQPYNTGGKLRHYHEIVLTLFCSQATSGTRRGSFQAENLINKGVIFGFVLLFRTKYGKIGQFGSV